GGDPDAYSPPPEGLDLTEVLGGGVLAEARQTSPRVGGEQQDEDDPGLLRGIGRCERFVEAEVVELADGRVARGPQLAVDGCVPGGDGLGGLALRLGEHALPPAPEVVPCSGAAQRALEGVRVRVDEPGQGEHGPILAGQRLNAARTARCAVMGTTQA